MHNYTIIRSSSNEAYAFCVGSQARLGQEKSTVFSDIYSAMSFIQRIRVSTETWQRLAYNCNNYRDWRNANPHAAVEKFIAEMIARRSINIFKVNEQVVTLTGKKGQETRVYAIAHPSALWTKPFLKKIQFITRRDLENEPALLNIPSEACAALRKFFPFYAETERSLSDQIKEKIFHGELHLVQWNAMKAQAQPEAEPDKTRMEIIEKYTPPQTTSTQINSIRAEKPSEMKIVISNPQQVETLKQAAKNGTAFCEVCSKATTA